MDNRNYGKIPNLYPCAMVFSKSKQTRPFFSPKSGKDKLYSTYFLQSWWVYLFVALGYIFYAQGVQKKEKVYADLSSRLKDLSKEKEALIDEREDLCLQINSQSDPAWIEMTLMKGLGVVPEGQLKVYFQNSRE